MLMVQDSGHRRFGAMGASSLKPIAWQWEGGLKNSIQFANLKLGARLRFTKAKYMVPLK